ncbi:MAG: hypothetical protein R3D44_00655 [Hyphomicrobiaceae bacterium]
MSETLEPLIVDLVVWCSARQRAYEDVIEAWRTSCPRLMVWEEAHTRGLVETKPGAHGLEVIVTTAGRALLEKKRMGDGPAQRGSIAPPAVARARPLRSA